MRHSCLFLIAFCLLLAACAAPAVSLDAPTSAPPTTAEVAVAQITPSATPTTTSTTKPGPSATRTPPPTATRRAATQTPIPSPTLPQSPTFTPIPYLDPTATPPPDARTITANNIGQLTELYRLGKGILNDVQWSPDGRWLGVATGLGVYLYDAQTLELARFIDAGEAVWAIAFSPNGKRLATGGETVQVWLTETGEANRKLEGRFGDGVMLVAWSPDGATIIAEARNFMDCCDGETIYSAWNASDGALLYSSIAYSYPGPVAISPNGQWLAGSSMTVGGNPITWVRDIRSFELVWTLENQKFVVDLEYSPDGSKLIASVGSANPSIVFNAGDGKLLQLTHSADNFALLPDGQQMVIIVGHKRSPIRILIWDLVDERQVNMFDLPDAASGCTKINISPSGKQAVCYHEHLYGDPDVIFDIANGQLIRALDFRNTYYTSVAFSPLTHSETGYTLAAGDESGVVQIWNVGQQNLQRIFLPDDWWIKDLAFSPDGRTLAASSGATIHFWDTASWQEYPPLKTQKSNGSFVFSKDGQAILIGRGTEREAWNLTTRNPIKDPLTVAWPNQGEIMINPQGHLIDFVREKYSLIYPRNELTGEALGLPSPDYSLFGFTTALSDNGNFLILGMWTGLWLWDLSAFGAPQMIGGHQNIGFENQKILSLAFNPYSNLLVSAGYDGNLMFWNPETGELLRTIPLYGPAYALAFSPDGRLLAVASGDGAVHVLGITP